MVTLGFIDTSKESQKPRISSVRKKMFVARSRISLNDVLTSTSPPLLGPGLVVASARAATAPAAGAGGRALVAAAAEARSEEPPRLAARSRCAMPVCVWSSGVGWCA